jgi:hypothetical protein
VGDEREIRREVCCVGFTSNGSGSSSVNLSSTIIWHVEHASEASQEPGQSDTCVQVEGVKEWGGGGELRGEGAQKGGRGIETEDKCDKEAEGVKKMWAA